MFRYYVKMKKDEMEIYGESFTKEMVLDYIKQQKHNGFKVIESNFDIYYCAITGNPCYYTKDENGNFPCEKCEINKNKVSL